MCVRFHIFWQVNIVCYLVRLFICYLHCQSRMKYRRNDVGKTVKCEIFWWLEFASCQVWMFLCECVSDFRWKLREKVSEHNIFICCCKRFVYNFTYLKWWTPSVRIRRIHWCYNNGGSYFSLFWYEITLLWRLKDRNCLIDVRKSVHVLTNLLWTIRNSILCLTFHTSFLLKQPVPSSGYEQHVFRMITWGHLFSKILQCHLSFISRINIVRIINLTSLLFVHDNKKHRSTTVC
jgi:hypothetical protein